MSENGNRVIELLKAGANPNELSGDQTPLITAIVNCVGSGRPIMMPIIEELLKAGADPNLKDGYNNTPLLKSIRIRENPDLIKMLLEAGANPNLETSPGITPLMESIVKKNTITPTMLLEAGADPNRQDPHGMNALYLAATSDNLPVIKMLIDHPAIQNLPITFEHGKTVLQLAQEGHFNPSVNELIIKIPSYKQRGVAENLTRTTTTGPFSKVNSHVFRNVYKFLGPKNLEGGRRRKTRRVKKSKKTMRRKTYNYRK